MKLLTPAQAGALFDPPLSAYRVTKLMDLGVLRSVLVGKGAKRFRRTTEEWVRGQTAGRTAHGAGGSCGAVRKSPVIGLEYLRTS